MCCRLDRVPLLPNNFFQKKALIANAAAEKPSIESGENKVLPLQETTGITFSEEEEVRPADETRKELNQEVHLENLEHDTIERAIIEHVTIATENAAGVNLKIICH